MLGYTLMLFVEYHKYIERTAISGSLGWLLSVVHWAGCYQWFTGLVAISDSLGWLLSVVHLAGWLVVDALMKNL